VRERPVSVLLVDDNPGFLRIAAAFLSRRYPTQISVVGTASTGAEAVQRAAELRPDAVLLDVGLGPENGLDLIPRLRGVPGPVVVVLTVHDSPSYAAAAMAAGADGYVAKARMASELWPALERALEGRLSDAGSGE
jgi:DNA-binding NarL/FixJ family response regulator